MAHVFARSVVCSRQAQNTPQFAPLILEASLIYSVPLTFCHAEYEVKKSRFIAQLHPVKTREQAMALLAKARQDYPDARHHCWAYVIGTPENPQLVAMSDDGEPSGTAGKPILNVMQHKAVGDIMVIVIRYFGGVKLGAGGLVRAYSSATQLAYEQVTLETPKDNTVKHLVCSFADEQRIRHWLSSHDAHVINCSYAKDVTMEVELETRYCSELGLLIQALKGASFLKID